LVHSKDELLELKKFEIKYGFKGFEERETFSIETSSVSKWILNKKFGKSRSIFEFRKLMKIARNGPKITEFVWR
jgi:hypothetical protein